MKWEIPMKIDVIKTHETKQIHWTLVKATRGCGMYPKEDWITLNSVNSIFSGQE